MILNKKNNNKSFDSIVIDSQAIKALAVTKVIFLLITIGLKFEKFFWY